MLACITDFLSHEWLYISWLQLQVFQDEIYFNDHFMKENCWDVVRIKSNIVSTLS